MTKAQKIKEINDQLKQFDEAYTQKDKNLRVEFEKTETRLQQIADELNNLRSERYILMDEAWDLIYDDNGNKDETLDNLLDAPCDAPSSYWLPSTYAC